MMRQLEDALRGSDMWAELGPDLQARLATLLGRFADELEGGPGGLSMDGLAGLLDDQPGGAINVLDGGHPGPCREILLACCSIRKAKTHHLPAVLRRVRAHLIQCFAVTRVVILLTDHWDPRDLDWSLAELEQHALRRPGVLFIPVLLSGRRLSVLGLGLPGH